MSVGDNIAEFATILEQPSRISIQGRDSSRCRVLVTLLHGNEPSGLMALHRLLREQFVPAVDMHCYVLAIDAALLRPQFTQRQVPGLRDWNRCFRPPFDTDIQAMVCGALLEELRALRPECVVDMHNTSGEGPSFAVATRYDATVERIVSHFTDRLVLSHMRLGALMETSTPELPVVTIECGGAFEESAHRVAWDGLRRFAGSDDLFAPSARDWGLELFDDPMRVELAPEATLDFAEAPSPGSDLTLKADIEHHNFGYIPAQTFLGWLRRGGPWLLRAVDARRRDHFEELYYFEDGKLYTKVAQKMFMITTNATIAKSDCLWYTVRA